MHRPPCTKLVSPPLLQQGPATALGTATGHRVDSSHSITMQDRPCGSGHHPSVPASHVPTKQPFCPEKRVFLACRPSGQGPLCSAPPPGLPEHTLRPAQPCRRHSRAHGTTRPDPCPGPRGTCPSCSCSPTARPPAPLPAGRQSGASASPRPKPVPVTEQRAAFLPKNQPRF